MEWLKKIKGSKKSSLILLLFINAVIAFLPLFLAGKNISSQFISSFNGFEYQSFSEFLSTWHKANLGTYTVLFTPQLLFAFILFKLVPDWLANILVTGIVKFAAGISIYVLLNKYTKYKSVQILGSIVYLLSIYGQAMTENSLSGGFLFYAFLPLYIYLFQYITKTNVPKYLFVYVLSLVFIVDTNFTYIVYLYLFFFLYAMYSWIFNKDFSRMKVLLLFGGIFILMSQVYYLPLFAYSFIYKANLVGINLAAESVVWKSSDSLISEIIRLMGSIDFYNADIIQNKIVYSHPFFLEFISNKWNVLLTFIMPLFAYLGFISQCFRTKKQEIASLGIFFLGTVLLYLFFSIGVHPSNPLYSFYLLLVQKMPFFSIFRDPYKSVSILNLLYVIGIVFFFNYLYPNKKYFKFYVAIILVTLVLLSQSYIRGELFSISEIVQIPHYVYELGRWNHSSKGIHDSKKLLLPSEPFPVLSLVKYTNKGSPLYFQILDSSSIQNAVTFTPFVKVIQESIYTPQYSQIAGFYNIPYSVVIHDLYSWQYHTENPDRITSLLAQSEKKVESFGNSRIEIFQTPQQFVNRTIYIPKRIINVESFDPKEINLQAIFSREEDNSFAFSTQKIVVSQQIPSIIVSALNNAEYTLNIKNIKGSFMLVFNENYSPSWVVKQPGSLFKILPINHIEVNGFTNGYVIDKQILEKYIDKKYISTNEDGSINVTLQLYFQPQIYFYIGLLISGLTLLVSFIFFLYSLSKKK